MDFCDRLGIEHAVLQAGMGGGAAGADLAVAVSQAGGLGTVGFTGEAAFREELRSAGQRLGSRPLAANLLLPFVRPGHVKACIEERLPVVSLFYGFDPTVLRDLKNAGIFVLYQIGSEAEAARVLEAGADGLIVQGFEAGGHIRGEQRLATLLPRIKERFPDLPVLASGGIHDATSVAVARSLGADAVSSGTCFLMTKESGAHDAYKDRLVAAKETLVTTLFGLGWSAPHRVLPNAATQRWCNAQGDAPAGIRALNRLFELGIKIAPLEMAQKLTVKQRANRPLFTPSLLSATMPAHLADVTALYAGECVANIEQVSTAAKVVADLAAGL